LYKLAIDDVNEESVVVSETIYSGKTAFRTSSKSVVKVFNNMVVICPDYRVDHPELGKNIIHIFDRSSGDLIRNIEHDDGMQNAMNMDVDNGRNTVVIWDHFGIDTHQDSIWYDHMYDRLFLSDNLWNIDVINTQNGKFMSKICIKEHRTEEPEDRMSNNLSECIFSITIKDNFIYAVTDIYAYILNRSNLTVLTSIKLSGQPIKVKFFPVTKNEITAFKENDKQIIIAKMIFGFSDRHSLSWSSVYHIIDEEEKEDNEGVLKTTTKSTFKWITEKELEKKLQNNPIYWRRPIFNYVQSTSNVNSVDINDTIAACASEGMKVNIFDLETSKKYSIPAGSKHVKSYKDHPQKPGVSEIKISEDKICLVLGNIMRVYSFDVEI
jgi:hypothetical protein